MKMRNFIDEPNFKHGCPWKKFQSSCRIRILVDDETGDAVVVVQETGNGTSVTNAAEQIATAVIKIYELDPARTTFIEHYPDDQTGGDENFSKVTFSTMEKTQLSPGATDGEVILISPVWTYLTKEDANKLCGGLL